MGCTGSKGGEGGSTPLTQAKYEVQDKRGSVLQFAESVPLFRRLPREDLPILADACEEVEFKPGQQVIREGDDGHEFFLIKEGQATVIVQHNTVATLKSGDYFGESSLLHDEPRTATVVALNRLVTLKITREKFQELGMHEHLYFANRKAVGDGETEHGRQVQTKPPSAKTPEEREAMIHAIRANFNLRTIHLDKSMVEEMVDAAWQEDVAVGTTLIQQGDFNADYFYVVKDGVFEISIKKEDKSKTNTVKKGACFGELALLYVAPRAATVTCTEKGAVWVIDRHTFKQILVKKSEQKVEEHATYLDRVEVLAPLTNEEKNKLAHALVEVHFTKDQIIMNQGDEGNAFYILFEGSVSVVKDGVEQQQLEGCHTKETAHVFGEKALLSGEKRIVTVTVISSTAKLFVLDREDFNILLGPLKDLLARSSVGALGKVGKDPSASVSPASSGAKKDKKPKGKAKGSAGSRSSVTKSDKARKPILQSELSVLGLLGCGGFGAVQLVQHKDSGESYALKAVSKGFVVQTGMKDSIMNEKMILWMLDSVFIIKLYETYNSDQSVYFLLELALGGELYATYNRRGFHGKEEHAKFYSAGVVFAFDHCHLKHVIYRDLKPENLLLTEKGHVKLTDMGLSKYTVGITYTTCGTPDYFCPELIESRGHTIAVDWWTLGILVYELMSGNPPFETEHPMQTYSKVMAGIDRAKIHPRVKGSLLDLVKAFLKHDPADRIGMLPGGTKNIQDHPWYGDFDWTAMENLTMEVPYKPTVTSKTDMKNFHAREQDMPPQVKYKDDGSGWDKDFATSS